MLFSINYSRLCVNYGFFCRVSADGEALIMSTRDLYVVMYADNAYNLTDTAQSAIDKVIIHTDFNFRTRANDIAIITLAKNIKLIENLAHVSKHAISDNEAGVIAGFGRLYDVILF